MKISIPVGIAMALLIYIVIGRPATRNYGMLHSDGTDSSDVQNRPSGLILIEHDLRNLSYNYYPQLGNRFVIAGDFDGDGKKDTLVEHFVSLLDGKETPKFYDSISGYDQLVDFTVHKEPYSFVSSVDGWIDTLRVSTDLQLLGLSYLKNEGDIDDDGGDEVSFLIDWADWSNVNTYHLVSYKKGKWVELYAFNVWDWQFPPLPDNPTMYGLFGTVGVVSTRGDDTMAMAIKKAQAEFPGVIKKVGRNKIEIDYMDSVADRVTAVIDLRREKPRIWKN
jgi:hypothetical protein